MLKNLIWRPLTQMKTAPLHMKVAAAEGIYLYLQDGQKIIDGISSWWVTLHGHGNKKLAEALFEQAQKLEQVTFADFTHEKAEVLAIRLVEALPARLKHLFFSDNGSTSVEVALKMAFQYWRNIGQSTRQKFIGFADGYHGDSVGAMSLGERSIYNRQFEPLLFPIETAPFPSTFFDDDKVEEKEKEALLALEKIVMRRPDEYAAIIIEPLVQGAGGMKICRSDFLIKLRAFADQTNLLLIFDEVMTGFGRTGKLFACDHASISPDIICLSKGLSGGMLPLAATICTSEIFDAFYSDDFEKCFTHSHSYTANPLGCATALASLELLKQEKPYEKIEKWHREFLKEFEKHPAVKKRRFLGTIAAMDIFSGEKTGYLNPIGPRLKAACLKRGLFLRPLGNVLYLMPPYCITREELSTCYQIIAEALLETIQVHSNPIF